MEVVTPRSHAPRWEHLKQSQIAHDVSFVLDYALSWHATPVPHYSPWGLVDAVMECCADHGLPTPELVLWPTGGAHPYWMRLEDGRYIICTGGDGTGDATATLMLLAHHVRTVLAPRQEVPDIDYYSPFARPRLARDACQVTGTLFTVIAVALTALVMR